MQKKINSEKKITYNDFKVIFGTTDKKNPLTVYAQIETFVTPNINYNDESVLKSEKLIKKYIKEKLEISNTFIKKHIFIFDIPSSEPKPGKKTFLSMQIHLKHKENVKWNNFEEAYEYCKKNSLNNIDCFKNILSENGFDISEKK